MKNEVSLRLLKPLSIYLASCVLGLTFGFMWLVLKSFGLGWAAFYGKVAFVFCMFIAAITIVGMICMKILVWVGILDGTRGADL